MRHCQNDGSPPVQLTMAIHHRPVSTPVSGTPALVVIAVLMVSIVFCFAVEQLFRGIMSWQTANGSTSRPESSFSTDSLTTKEMFFDVNTGNEWRLKRRQHSSHSLALTPGFQPIAVSSLDCGRIWNELSIVDFRASGWTKAVYRARLNGTEVALKVVDFDGHDMRDCQRHMEEDCYARVADKFVKEILLFHQLQHPTVIRMLGYCIPRYPSSFDDGLKWLAIVTELGQPVELLQLLQMTWKQRLKNAITVKIGHLTDAVQ
ncbi:unnamed protein product [Soboliphyme baturini]|uniref:Protein kinase domain-containing protein n=1 Tax=Soboliphyme baturini TaxID=241478 RepID=A0A183IX11_9BILA|nr:unnamed protein product [Soboliphyme baturini]